MHRPSAKDTQDDILRQHAEFLKQKAANKVELAVSKLVADPKVETEAEDEIEGPSEEEILACLANTFECVPYGAKIGDIIEHPSSSSRGPDFTHSRTTGFPVARRRDLTIKSTMTESIFELDMKKKRKLLSGDDPDPKNQTAFEKQQQMVEQQQQQNPISFKNYLQKGLVQDEGIHEENVKKIEQMSEEDIVRERENLIATMDPELIAFLKDQNRKRRTIEENAGNRNATIKEQNEADAMEVDEVRVPILDDPNVEKWLNFDVIEPNKLAWMRDAAVPKKGLKDGYEARFDFEGWLLPYTENEMTEKSRALYHHGEESGRPGYTLQELFQLSRSSVRQQAVVALNTIANILSLQQTGVYSSLDIPTEQIFFVIRHCLDDNTPSVLNACIKAMRNLVYDKIDETCLDSLLGFGLGHTQPILAVEADDDHTINDQQLAENDLIKCLARTDIVTRIRYVLNVVEPPIETVAYSIDILTRMARDSKSVVDKIMQTDGLVSSIIEKFVEKNPLAQAVKLLRVLACRDRSIARDLLKKYSVLNPISCILCDHTYRRNANGMKLQTQCMFFWACLCEYDLGFEQFRFSDETDIDTGAYLNDQLRYHLHNTDLYMRMTFVRNEHVAALLGLIGAVAKTRLDLLPRHTLRNTDLWFRKVVSQFKTLPEFTCGKLQLISSLYCAIDAIKHYNALQMTSELLDSQGFSVVTETITNGSMLLNNYETRKSSANLKTLEAAAWYASEHVIPLVQSNSCIPFVTAISSHVVQTNDAALTLKFLRHGRIARYIEALRSADSYHLINNWFTRIEAQFIMNVLKMSVQVQKELDSTAAYYELAIKSLSIFSSEQKDDLRYLFKSIVFDSGFYPSDVRLANLSLENLPGTLRRDLARISNVYIDVLGLGLAKPTTKPTNPVADQPTETLSLDCRIGSVVPIDWIYTPILLLYADNESSSKDNLKSCSQRRNSQEESTIKDCLKWILIYETYFPRLAAGIDVTDRFCRIACLFLGSDSLFLNPDIRSLLERCLKNVLKFEKDLNFNRKIEGLTDFQKFYTQMLEQFQAVSYGDVLFGNFVLVPLAQRHNVLWRKILWSEYMGVVETFNVTPEQCVCDLSSFLEPAEEDVSLLKCYRKGLGGGSVRKHSVLYTIAKHHVEKYIEIMKNSK